MINVFSEIGKLKTVLLHRPNLELENLTPDSMARLLFDDIPYLKIAQQEHDAFANILKQHGTQVVYVEKLAADALKQSPSIKEEFIKELLKESNIACGYLFDALLNYLKSFSEEELIDKVIAGVRSNEVNIKSKTLAMLSNHDWEFYLDPMPNILFTRDNFASMGKGITLNTMYSVTRNRECLLYEYIFKYHPEYKNTPKYFNRFAPSHIEGGDELILSENTLAIGISQRTKAESIEELAKNLFSSDTSFKKILAFKIPKKRAFMHLDTVFTQVDIDKFTLHPEATSNLEVFTITPSGKELNISAETTNLDNILSKALDVKVKLLKCGNNDNIAAAREQWNDGSNTLAIAPGEVIVYSRNHVTNKLLVDNGIKAHEIPSSELSRGRGGPRCMSMPLYRQPVNK